MRERKKIRVNVSSLAEFDNILKSYYGRNIMVTGSYVNISNIENNKYPPGTGYIEIVVENGNKVCYYNNDEDEYIHRKEKNIEV
ncbi:hypothetical protein B7939_00580 [Eggerthia catenaformis]|nr:hypothetical protein B7939_00580 [Eggerthia catenaformis]